LRFPPLPPIFENWPILRNSMSDKDKRIMFHIGAAAAAKYRGGDSSLYFCPICGRGFGIGATETGDLTIEHVPPRATGGKPLLLTCAECNSQAGHKIDFHAANESEINRFTSFFSSQDDTLKHCTLQMEEENIVVELSKKEKLISIKVIGNCNNPITLEKLNHHFVELQRSGTWDGHTFSITKAFKLDLRILHLSYLRTAFLLLTAWLGYRFAFDHRMEVIRKQILNPDQNIMSGEFCFKRSGSCEHMPRNVIMNVSLPFSHFLVSFDNFFVVFPHPSSSTNIYDQIKMISNMHTQITGRIFSWPSSMTMLLDQK